MNTLEKAQTQFSLRHFPIWAKKFMALTPFELRRRLPQVTIDAVHLLLISYLRSMPAPVLVQIGACDGLGNDPVHEFVRRGRLRALLIEPVPRSFEKLKSTYAGVPNITFLNAAVTSHDHDAIMYCARAPADSSQSDADVQLASFYRPILLKHGIPPADIEEIHVPCRCLATLTADYQLGQINFLQIDAEGHDVPIILMALQLAQPPDCINFEHIHLSAAERRSLFPALASAGYVWIHDGMNTLALRRDALQQLMQF